MENGDISYYLVCKKWSNIMCIFCWPFKSIKIIIIYWLTTTSASILTSYVVRQVMNDGKLYIYVKKVRFMNCQLHAYNVKNMLTPLNEIQIFVLHMG